MPEKIQKSTRKNAPAVVLEKHSTIKMEPKYDQSVEIYQKLPDANSEIQYDINSAIYSEGASPFIPPQALAARARSLTP